MSDNRLRELETRFHQTGSLEDEVALILERIRIGDLEPYMLSVAAHCLHPAALAVAETEGRDDFGSLSHWAIMMPSINEHPQLAALIACIAVKHLLLVYEESFSLDYRLRQTLICGLKYALHGQLSYLDLTSFDIDERIEHVEEAMSDIDEDLSNLDEEDVASMMEIFPSVILHSIRWLIILLTSIADGEDSTPRYIDPCLRECENSLGLFNGSSQYELKEDVYAFVISWALGESDPLLDLVAQLESTPTQD